MRGRFYSTKVINIRLSPAADVRGECTPSSAAVSTPSVVECLDATTTGCVSKSFSKKNEALESASLQAGFGCVSRLINHYWAGRTSKEMLLPKIDGFSNRVAVGPFTLKNRFPVLNGTVKRPEPGRKTAFGSTV